MQFLIIILNFQNRPDLLKIINVIDYKTVYSGEIVKDIFGKRNVLLSNGFFNAAIRKMYSNMGLAQGYAFDLNFQAGIALNKNLKINLKLLSL